jgi:hypothetical protein
LLVSSEGRKGLVGVERWAELRREHFVRGVLIKALARRTGLSRNTVRAALRSPRPPGCRRARVGSKLDPFKHEIHRLLGEEPELPGQRVRELIEAYNADRPHQALETRAPVTLAERFQPAADEQRELLPLWLPGALSAVAGPARNATVEQAVNVGAAPEAPEPGAVELDRVVPPSGNMWVASRQFWLGPARAGQTVRFWASVDVIHLSIAGARVKSLRSHFSSADLAQLAQQGATPAGPPPLPSVTRGDGGAIEVDRSVSNSGIVSLAGHQVLAAEILRGRQVSIGIEPKTLLFSDPQTRELLRARPNPLTPDQALRLRGARPAGPPPRPRTEPVTVQRRVSATGVIVVCRQRVALGRIHAGRMISIHVSERTLAIELGDDTRTVRRTTTRPVVGIKGSRRQHPARAATGPALSSSAGRETEPPR